MTQQSQTPAILLHAVSKSFGSETLVSAVRHQLQAGEREMLVGHNGPG